MFLKLDERKGILRAKRLMLAVAIRFWARFCIALAEKESGYIQDIYKMYKYHLSSDI